MSYPSDVLLFVSEFKYNFVSTFPGFHVDFLFPIHFYFLVHCYFCARQIILYLFIRIIFKLIFITLLGYSFFFPFDSLWVLGSFTKQVFFQV